MLTSLIRASRIKNDVLPVRLPIHKYLLHLIQKELVKYCEERNQCYLQLLYLALFSTAYYGLLRIGEVTYSQHVLLAKDVHVGTNKNKMLLVLHTSKTHGKGDKPQMIKISATPITKEFKHRTNVFCPFKLLKDFIEVRPVSMSHNEQFFVFTDGSPVYPTQARNLLKTLIKRIGLDENRYNFHGFRGGMAGDLLDCGVSVETIKKIRHWKSNVVFSYLKS